MFVFWSWFNIAALLEGITAIAAVYLDSKGSNFLFKGFSDVQLFKCIFSECGKNVR